MNRSLYLYPVSNFFCRLCRFIILPPLLAVFIVRAARYRARNLFAIREWVAAPDRRLRLYAAALGVIEALYRQLTGENLSPSAQRRAALMSALVPLFDDLIDVEGYTSAELENLCRLQTQRGTPAESLTIRLFDAGGWTWDEIWQTVLEAQLTSGPQLMKGGLSPEQLDRITREKGGQAVLLGQHTIVGGQPELREAAYALGAVAQYVNDLFDVWKDREAGVQTLFSSTKKHFEFGCRQFEYAAAELRQQIGSLPFPAGNKMRTQLLVSLFIALGYTALRRLQSGASKIDNDLPFDRLSRRDLICDMALWRNRMMWVRYVWRLSC